MSGAGKVVCVTGASGYVASWLVKMLLECGYTVKASVRDLNDPDKMEHLISLDGAKERLHLFAADLMKDGSFDEMVDGCEGVFLTAYPLKPVVSDPEAELLDPAVKGTLNVLQSCARVSSVKRVVVTSSMASIAYNRELKNGVVVDESWFSEASYSVERKLWYILSRTLAETAAWNFSKEHGIEMITIHPSWIVGPHLQPSINISVQLILNLLNGDESFPYATFNWVDVRDVAYAHVLAFENPSASGRYCLVERAAHTSQVIKILQELYPTHQFPDKFSHDSILINPDYSVSNEKAKALGVEFIPLEESLKDTIEGFKKKNLVSL
ncbi:phenylacetaldehyde reductase-like [Coffea arabica]|uniref:Phenylacetaldehyde reductase-like n=1 Tax=Coffea arabica TaxID=13443 RepID=A0A6P6VWP8_COFAR